MRGIVLTLVALLVVAACPASAQEFLRYGLLVPAGTPGAMQEYFKAEDLARAENATPEPATETKNEESFDIF